MTDERDEIEYPYDLIRYDNPDEMMFIDSSVQMPSGLPKLLSAEIARMILHKKNGRYLHFENAIMGLEGLVKNFHSVGEITDEQARAIFQMFGWRW